VALRSSRGESLLKQKYQLQTANGAAIPGGDGEMLRLEPPWEVVRWKTADRERMFMHFPQNLHGGSDTLVYREATFWEHTESPAEAWEHRDRG
jgi:hypothetical protein